MSASYYIKIAPIRIASRVYFVGPFDSRDLAGIHISGSNYDSDEIRIDGVYSKTQAKSKKMRDFSLGHLDSNVISSLPSGFVSSPEVD